MQEPPLIRGDASFNRAVGALRAAGLGQSSWAEASRLACDVIGADAAAFIVWRSPERSVDLMEGHGHDGALVREYNEHYCRHDVLLQFARPTDEWQVSDEAYPERQWGRHEFFGGFLRRHGVNQILALTLRLDKNAAACLSFHRQNRMNTRASNFETGRPRLFTRHVQHAFSLREALINGARTTLDEALTTPDSICLLLDAHGRGQAVSPLRSVRQLLSPSKLEFDGLALRHADPRTDAGLHASIAEALAGKPNRLCVRAGPQIAFGIEAQEAPTPAKLAPTQKLALVRVSVLRKATPAEENLRSLFGLTRTEARVLAGLCAGLSVKECAHAMKSREATVRTHVSHLLNKMDCRRQSDLVRAAMTTV